MAKKSLTSKVDSLIEGMLGRFEKMEKIAIDQFPELCKEIIAERKVELQNVAILGSIGLVVCAIVIVISYSAFAFSEEKAFIFLGGVVVLVFSLVALVAGSEVVGSLLKVRELNAAPKLFVLNKLRRMISRG